MAVSLQCAPLFVNERLSVAVTSFTPLFAEVLIEYGGFMTGLALLLVYTPVT